MNDEIEITGVNLVQLVKDVYELSYPQGLGHLHYKADALTDKEAMRIIELSKDNKHFAVSMDYVHGRACKFIVRREDMRLFIAKKWYDHTDYDLEELLKRIGIERISQ